MNKLYELPDLDDLDYIGDTITPIHAKADDAEVKASFTFDSDAIKAALKRIYEKDFHPMTEIEENLFNETCRIFDDASNKGFSQSAEEITPDFREIVEHNNAVFSAFKVHRMQNDIARQLYDEDGKLKTFEKWKADTESLVDHHVNAWLRTEYNTAVLRAQQAADWQRFEREKDILPNLEWMPSTSATPGEDHRIFWGTIRPVNDPFWDLHKPLDRWGCKCALEPTTEEPTKVPDGGGKGNTPAPGLDNNPGKDGKLFSDSHPYVKNAYKGAEKAVEKFMEERVKSEGEVIKVKAENETMKLYQSYDEAKWIKDFYNNENGGFLVTHKERKESGMRNKQERAKFEKEHNMCIAYANAGYRMEHLSETPGVSSPDVTINGISADLKRTKGGGNIVRYAHKAVNEQGSGMVLFQFDNWNGAIRNELAKLKKEGIKVKYFITGENNIYTL